ncbi:MAG: UdgX family uracil-DNA binding protein [Bradyrhizobiaceae bacterium]|nr:UdgX family uracil-DNA binding protein [Bradyrhizobiaceae bacterium]
MPAPAIKSLKGLREAEARCTRCPLYADATQAVPGEGPLRARLMLVGEQPGDQEDKQGHPFVGPAGRLLDQAIAGAGLDRSEVLVTNAVKHFKHELRGKRRLHKRPNTYEIDRCKWWLDLELVIVRPRGIVALGATAARSLFGRPVPVEKSRRRQLALADGTPVFVTQHPSAMLRIEDRAERRARFRQFTGDLRHAARHLSP